MPQLMCEGQRTTFGNKFSHHVGHVKSKGNFISSKGRRDKGLCVEPISLLKLTLASRLPQNHKYLLDLSKFIPALSSHLFYPHSPASHSPCNSAISAVVSPCLLLHLLCWLMLCPSASIFCLCLPVSPSLFVLSVSVSASLPLTCLPPQLICSTISLLHSFPASVLAIFSLLHFLSVLDVSRRFCLFSHIYSRNPPFKQTTEQSCRQLI